MRPTQIELLPTVSRLPAIARGLQIRHAIVRARATRQRARPIAMDYYEELGLARSATDIDIKKACVPDAPSRRDHPRTRLSLRTR